MTQPIATIITNITPTNPRPHRPPQPSSRLNHASTQRLAAELGTNWNPLRAILTYEGTPRPTLHQEPCCCRSEARVRTRQFPHAPTPAYTKCASGFARVTTSPDVHVAVRKLRRRARTLATSISELSQEREVKGEVAGASHQGPVLLRLREVAAETQRTPIPRAGRSLVREATATTRSALH